MTANAMTTRLVGLREFRQNMAQISNRARKRNERLIILRKNMPVFEVRTFSEQERILERLMADIEEARESARAGRVYTTEELRRRLGL